MWAWGNFPDHSGLYSLGKVIHKRHEESKIPIVETRLETIPSIDALIEKLVESRNSEIIERHIENLENP